MSDRIRVAVIGSCGRMGREVIKAVCATDDMDVVAAVDVASIGINIGKLAGIDGLDVVVESDIKAAIKNSNAQVAIDFSKPFNLDNVIACADNNCACIIGTTGQTQSELNELEEISKRSGVAVMVIPNFAIGAVLMMKFASEAAKYMPEVEIIELHHDKKLDAPSGTSIKTAEMIDLARKESGVIPVKPLGADDPARGEKRNDVYIHSVRLPGLVAHQEVIFGGQGQILTIRHDSIDRTSFMPGVLLTIRKAASGSKNYVYGLDKLI